MRRSIPLIVFSDLDGTLLDHSTYSWAPAQPALDRLAAQDVPVVLATSKTASETAHIQAQLGLSTYPAIVENGAGLTGLDLPEDEIADAYSSLRSALDTLPSELRAGYTGFGDMSVDDISRVTALPIKDAERAKARTFSEPGIWTGSNAGKQAFLAKLAEEGVVARSGGRFLTLSFGKTKMDRMAQVLAHLGARTSIALGDAPNDVEMLEAADHGVIVANPHHPPLPELRGEDSGRVIRTVQAGPAGWNEAVNAFLDAQDLKKKESRLG